MVAQVLVEIKKIDKTFTYLIPNDLKNINIGCRVIVPFGNKKLEGFVIKLENEFNGDYELKNIISLVDEKPILNDELLDLGSYLSKKTLCNLINAYQTMLPSALKAKEGFVVNKKYINYLKKIKEYEPKTDNERLILDLFNEDEVLECDAKKVSSYTTKKLIEKGILVIIKKEIYRLKSDNNLSDNKFELNEEQKKVIKEVEINKFTPYLLHGVTGSGKTEVYMHLIEEVIKNGKQALVLVPEIGLTPQLVDTFRKRFSEDIAILHSGLSNGEKYDEWRKINEHKVAIVIGTRSAVFAPLNNIGIIIIDEEHSNSYKQDNNPRYNAIDIALYRAKKHNAPLIMGSATPSIESYTRAKMGIYKLLEMKKRINNNYPLITLVDMKSEIKNKNRIFSSILIDKIQEKLNKKEQIILLLNRRGYTTIVTCKNCGYVDKCPKCDIPLTYHLKTHKMVCHYCEFTKEKLMECPICHSNDINERGMGTEKLEIEVSKLFPNAKILRMDFDTTRIKNSYQKIIKSFTDKEYDILIGTQMIAKGLDFPNVTLVGVINGDASLNIPDFRSGERTFQLLNQVAGRSGRSNLNGEVIIQGFNIDHYSLICVKNNDYLSFYNKEISLRKKLGYPPFYNLCLIKVQGLSDLKCQEEAKKIACYLKNNLKEEIILGPTAATISKINNVYFYQIIIKYNNNVIVSVDFNPDKI